jgi:hypothetical protein
MKTEEQRVLDELYNRDSRSGWKYPDTKIKKTVNNQEHPDPLKHRVVSFIKSSFRILGYGLLLLDLTTAVIILIASEVVGIIEELV